MRDRGSRAGPTPQPPPCTGGLAGICIYCSMEIGTRVETVPLPPPETTMPTALPLRLLQLITGLFLYGFGAALMIRAGIGVAPWDVLSQGIAVQTPLSFGLATNAIGALVLLLWWPLRQKPGAGTVLNVLLIGPSAQVGLWLLPAATGLAWQLALFASGLLLVALATGLYIGARLGPGPRDGLMTGLHARTGWPIWKVRSLIEGSVLLLGWWLGGDVGLGTLVFALSIGPLCGITLGWFGIGRPLPAGSTAPHLASTQRGHG